MSSNASKSSNWDKFTDGDADSVEFEKSQTDQKATPLDYLQAAIELAEEAPRDENGFLTEEGRKLVEAAYGQASAASTPKPTVKPSPFRKPS